MKKEHDQSSLMAFFELQETNPALAAAWKVIEPHMDELLSRFYDHVGNQPDLIPLLNNSSRSVDTLKDAQRHHWQGAMCGALDAEYFQRVASMGQVHARIKLTPDWFMGGYLIIITQALPHFLHAGRQTVWRKKADIRQAEQALAIFIRFVFFDMALAVQAYDNVSVELLEHITKLMNTTRQSTEEIGARLETTAAATEEMSASIDQISQEAGRNSSLSASAADQADGLRQQMREVGQLAENINDLSELIKDVADQTNLLALNAAIEAARAGDAERGFSVVAEEVGKLATRANDSANDVADQVKHIHHQITAVTSHVAEVAESIAQVRQGNNSISAAVSEQSTAVGEVSVAINAITTNVAEMIDVAERGAGS